MARRTGILGFLATLIATLLVLWAPLAIAGPDEAPGQQKKQSSEEGDHDGDADSDTDTAYTEDNDTNDGGTPNNVADEGDNQHPSGKDKSVENGNSGNQGNSESNPDDTNGPLRSEGEAGSPDKPNGQGGEDLADQDGNNGCGNDDDFDDDNNGWCGKPAETEGDEVEGEVIEGDETPGVIEFTPTQVEGDVIRDLPTDLPGVATNPAAPETEVLGEFISRDSNPAVAAAGIAPAVEAEGAAALPFTGGSIVQMLVTGMSLVTLGGLSVLARKR